MFSTQPTITTKFGAVGFDSSFSTQKASRISMQASVSAAPTEAANFYEVLNLKPTATEAEIKAAYRNLAKRFHPDVAKCGSDSRDFIAIQNAYCVLSDPTGKSRYDMMIGARGGGGRQRNGYVMSSSDFVSQPKYQTSRRWETDQCW